MHYLIEDIREVLVFMHKTGIRFKFFSLSVFFSVGLAFLNIYTIALLFPLSKGIIENNFDHLKNEKVVGFIIKTYPDIFSSSIRMFLLLVLWLYIVIILKNILQYLAVISTDYQARTATSVMRNMLLDRFFLFGKSFFDINKKHTLHLILTKSSLVIEKQFTLFKNLITQSFLFIIFLFFMIKISLVLTVISIVVFPFINILINKSVKKVKDLLKESEKADDDLNSKVSNMINSIPLIMSFVREAEEKEDFRKTSKDQLHKSFRAKKISSLVSPIEDIGSTTAMLFLAFGIAFVMHLIGGIDPTSAFVFLHISQKMIHTINSFNTFSLGVAHTKKDVKEINKILIENEDHCMLSGEKKLDDLKNGIEIKNLNFSYKEGGKSILADLSMFIPKGKTVAIVGPTGSGKSTLVNILLRFYDVEPGTVFIDGVDIREFDIKSLRAQISFVNQEPILLNDTVLHNVSYGKDKDIDDAFVLNASKKLTVDTFVQKMPKKYETIIGENGSNLSGGQKQRISILRALVKKSTILILDEATSSLDAEVEKKVIEGIEEYSKDKTKIIISHKLLNIQKADSIFFIKNGQVVERGTLNELLDMKGEFYKNWQLQKIS